MEKTKSNQKRAKVTILLKYLVLMSCIALIINNFSLYYFLKDIMDGKSITPEQVSGNTIRGLVFSVLNICLTIVSFIAFVCWFRRAYYNLHQRFDNLEYTDGWAVGAWFVPILNLYAPYSIMKEMYNNSLTLLRYKTKGSTSFMTYVGWWWTVWIISSVFGSFTTSFSSLEEKSLQNLFLITHFSIIGGFLSAILSIFYLKIIKDYSQIESSLEQQDLDGSEPLE